jgi:predicted kinase
VLRGLASERRGSDPPSFLSDVLFGRGDEEPVAVTGRLILLCGIAGAGKTTLAKQLEAGGAVRMCPDEWLVALGFDIYDKDARVSVEGLQWALSQTLALRGFTVVDESGVWQRGQRELRRTWAREHGVAVELRFLDAPVKVLTARVAERNRSLPEGAPRINPALVAFWNDRIERPDADELILFDGPVATSQPPDGVAP